MSGCHLSRRTEVPFERLRDPFRLRIGCDFGVKRARFSADGALPLSVLSLSVVGLRSAVSRDVTTHTYTQTHEHTTQFSKCTHVRIRAPLASCRRWLRSCTEFQTLNMQYPFLLSHSFTESHGRISKGHNPLTFRGMWTAPIPSEPQSDVWNKSRFPIGSPATSLFFGLSQAGRWLASRKK